MGGLLISLCGTSKEKFLQDSFLLNRQKNCFDEEQKTAPSIQDAKIGGKLVGVTCSSSNGAVFVKTRICIAIDLLALLEDKKSDRA